MPTAIPKLPTATMPANTATVPHSPRTACCDTPAIPSPRRCVASGGGFDRPMTRNVLQVILIQAYSEDGRRCETGK